MACAEIVQLPDSEQKSLRQGVQKGNMIFKKGRPENLTLSDDRNGLSVLAKPMEKPDKPKLKLIGKAMHYFPKAGIAQFLLEHGKLKIGDPVLIKGPTTGEKHFEITSMYVRDVAANTAKKGDLVSFNLGYRIRLSDQLHLILS